ncbi:MULTISPECIES: RNA-binding domain-containing protein [Sedimentibacter]|uniref:DNA binding domain-containing protein n=1 Tax=Sedimentibacter hydroxybenzoicus DSM 7310 TaxID=1123245 RepID=A0A974GWI4_SEDHY|nr:MULTISPECIES: RNA-binding domain-containing protein [Sedimentibacter]NYB74527.1 putative DNA binding domain-containing protein [Sedimentibacter hydroxybenzoicus DSM 7310]
MENKEKFNLEFKLEVSKTFLKTVSAYANYNDGVIVFGVDDDGEIIGIENATEESLRIENMVNDSIVPVPIFEIKIKKADNNKIIVLEVKKGKDTPFYYQGKAYKRANTSTVEVDRFELRRLSMEGLNVDYEERKASSQNLSFAALEELLKEKVGIEKINLDILRTLNLFSKEGYYNIAGELLADKNEVDFSGIDIIKFGKNINKILYRETIANESLLVQFDRAIKIFEQYYQYEEIDGYDRIKRELIPKEAFREALANAIVHRVWDINSYIQISMYEERIEINSPGGLPAGISKEEYLNGNISVLRNPIIAGVFYRLNIIEKFGTGIARINEEYIHSISKPNFDISENRIRIILPVTEFDKLDLSKEEVLVYGLLKEEVELTRKEIDSKTGFDKSKTLRVINNLIEKNIIEKTGSGVAVTYKVK